MNETAVYGHQTNPTTASTESDADVIVISSIRVSSFELKTPTWGLSDEQQLWDWDSIPDGMESPASSPEAAPPQEKGHSSRSGQSKYSRLGSATLLLCFWQIASTIPASTF
ncbi:unnamed protein product [Pleuronectes platessa]|uniref:Uncharacterized protein n=1 Tax=Pleuronectes platessa TaxID=8262 RepID=A0A9N7V7D8_PLEPL|nr:unnamed protein product [Pleuronectes platessa]